MNTLTGLSLLVKLPSPGEPNSITLPIITNVPSTMETVLLPMIRSPFTISTALSFKVRVVVLLRYKSSCIMRVPFITRLAGRAVEKVRELLTLISPLIVTFISPVISTTGTGHSGSQLAGSSQLPV